MKNVLIALSCLIMFYACQQNRVENWTKESPEIDMAKILVQEYENGNWEVWSSHYADTAKIYHNSTTGISSGDLQQRFQNELEILSEYGFQDSDIYYEMVMDENDHKWVYFWGNWEGTIAETQEQVVVPVHVAWWFEDSKIVEEYAYYDNLILTSAVERIESSPENE